MSTPVLVALIVGGYAALTIILAGLYILWCEHRFRVNVRRAERRLFELHAAAELRDHLRVVGGARVSSDERYGRAA